MYFIGGTFINFCYLYRTSDCFIRFQPLSVCGCQASDRATIHFRSTQLAVLLHTFLGSSGIIFLSTQAPCFIHSQCTQVSGMYYSTQQQVRRITSFVVVSILLSQIFTLLELQFVRTKIEYFWNVLKDRRSGICICKNHENHESLI